MNKTYDSKRAIRKTILKKRGLASKEEVLEKSRIIINRLINLKHFGSCSDIMCYMDFRNEVMTAEFINFCLFQGRRISIPKIEKVKSSGQSKLTAYEINDIKDVETGAYGILEPVGNTAKRINPRELDMICVPGVVFDIKGNRIGYGRGYYDRFLKETGTNCIKVGIAFDIQILDSIPSDIHDVTMDVIVTEKRVIERNT